MPSLDHDPRCHSNWRLSGSSSGSPDVLVPIGASCVILSYIMTSLDPLRASVGEMDILSSRCGPVWRSKALNTLTVTSFGLDTVERARSLDVLHIWKTRRFCSLNRLGITGADTNPDTLCFRTKTSDILIWKLRCRSQSKKITYFRPSLYCIQHQYLSWVSSSSHLKTKSVLSSILIYVSKILFSESTAWILLWIFKKLLFSELSFSSWKCNSLISYPQRTTES